MSELLEPNTVSVSCRFILLELLELLDVSLAVSDLRGSAQGIEFCAGGLAGSGAGLSAGAPGFAAPRAPLALNCDANEGLPTG